MNPFVILLGGRAVLLARETLVTCIYIYNLDGISLAKRGGLDPAGFSTPVMNKQFQFQTKCYHVRFININVSILYNFIISYIYIISSLSNKLALYILNNCYSLGRPIGLRNYLPLILMGLTKGGNLDQNTALVTAIE